MKYRYQLLDQAESTVNPLRNSGHLDSSLGRGIESHCLRLTTGVPPVGNDLLLALAIC